MSEVGVVGVDEVSVEEDGAVWVIVIEEGGRVERWRVERGGRNGDWWRWRDGFVRHEEEAGEMVLGRKDSVTNAGAILLYFPVRVLSLLLQSRMHKSRSLHTKVDERKWR